MTGKKFTSLLRADRIFGEKTRTLFIDSNLGLVMILTAAAALRFYALDRQSLWLDELHTMNEASPALPFSELLHYLSCCDQHPPVYFLLEKAFFSVFGYTSFVARALSAILGIGSVWVMYCLGKELSGKKLGLIVAAMTAINYYNIFYSQEARDYIMAFFFSALSFLYFFRLVKSGGRKNAWLYGLCALGVMYSHYYGLFLVTGQYAAAFCLWLIEKPERKRLFRTFFLSAVIFIVGYLPWTPVLKEMSQIKSFWASPVHFDLFRIYFFDYFGDYQSLKPFLLLGVAFFLYRTAIAAIPFKRSVIASPVLLCFVSFSVTVLVALGIPYIRSVLVVPMLIERYTIVIIPAVIIVIGFAFDLLPSSVLRSVVFAGFLIISFSRMVFSNKFYTRLRKTQFRELNEFIMSDPGSNQYPMINERTAWHNQYYLDHYHYTGKVLTGNKEALVDSILSRSSRTYNLAGFWIIGAHGGEKKLADSTRIALDTAYRLVKEKDFFDAWAELYVSKKVADSVQAGKK